MVVVLNWVKVILSNYNSFPACQFCVSFHFLFLLLIFFPKRGSVLYASPTVFFFAIGATFPPSLTSLSYCFNTARPSSESHEFQLPTERAPQPSLFFPPSSSSSSRSPPSHVPSLSEPSVFSLPWFRSLIPKALESGSRNLFESPIYLRLPLLMRTFSSGIYFLSPLTSHLETSPIQVPMPLVVLDISVRCVHPLHGPPFRLLFHALFFFTCFSSLATPLLLYLFFFCVIFTVFVNFFPSPPTHPPARP